MHLNPSFASIIFATNEAFAVDFALCQVGFKIRQEKKGARLDYPGAHLCACLDYPGAHLCARLDLLRGAPNYARAHARLKRKALLTFSVINIRPPHL